MTDDAREEIAKRQRLGAWDHEYKKHRRRMPHLRARLRVRIMDNLASFAGRAEDPAVIALGDHDVADRVLDRLSAEHGSGGLLDLLLKIDWVKLLDVILAVVALFKSSEGMDQLRQAESD